MRRFAAFLPVALVLAGLAGSAASGDAANAAPQEPDSFEPSIESLQSHQTPQWYEDAKFGIFIHWGPYSVPAWGPRGSYAEWYWAYMNDSNHPTYDYHRQTYGEDYPYDRFAEEWQAENFAPEEWVDLFEDAGARYFVLTTKHHDGVSLFDSPGERDTVAMGPGRDLVGELTAAAEDSHLKTGFYFSLSEFYNPAYSQAPRNPYTGQAVPYTGAPEVEDFIQDYIHPQMYTLIENYDPDILWCDGDWERDAPYWDLMPVLADYYNQAQDREHPKEVAVANRCEIVPGEDRSEQLDFTTPEYEVEADIAEYKWEASRGIGGSYGFNQNEPIEDYQTSDELIDSLADIVSKNGNLLLNVGPRGDGTIPELQVERLRDIGAWLEVNGEAIYGTTYFSRAEEPASDVPVRYTMRDGALYAIALEWPGETLTLGSDLPVADDAQVTLLGNDGGPLAWERDGAGQLLISPPPGGAGATSSEHAFVFKIDNPGASLVRLDVDVDGEVAPGTTGSGSVRLTNPGDAAVAGELTLTAPEGWTVEPASSAVDVGPGEEVAVPFSVGVPAGSGTTQGAVMATLVSDGLTMRGEGEVVVDVPNLSEGRDATQQATAYEGVASRAVDGNTDGNFAGNSVTHTTEPSDQAWWQVDLEDVAEIGRVDVWNRTDCCTDRLSDFWVMVSEEPFTADGLEEARDADGVTAVHHAATAQRPSRITLPEGTTGRYVRIQLESGVDPLSLAEVEVRGNWVEQGPTDPLEGIAQLSQSLADYVDSGDVAGPIAGQLGKAVELAERHLAGERATPALRALERFVRHLDNPKRPDTLTDQAQADLRSQVEVIIDLVD